MTSQFSFDLANLVGTHCGSTDDEVSLLYSQSTVLTEGRARIVKNALADNLDWILWLDSDMSFPADTLHRLLKHNKSLVACNCPGRVEPIRSTAYKLNETRTGLTQIETGPRGLIKATTVGMAVMLTEVNLFRRIELPYFDFPWNTTTKRHMGEDVHFCARMADAGVQLWIDTDLSEEIGHTGSKTFYLEHHRATHDLYDPPSEPGGLAESGGSEYADPRFHRAAGGATQSDAPALAAGD